MDTTPAGRLRLEVRRDKKGYPQHKEDPQEYKDNGADTNEHRNDSHRDYLHLPVESTPAVLFESRPRVKLTPGTLASSGGAKVLYIEGRSASALSPCISQKAKMLRAPQTGKTTHKFVIVLNKKLEPGTALNACAHMAATLVARADDETRKHMSFVDYVDADGNVHPVSALSLVVLSAKNASQVRTARLEVIQAGLPYVDFTETMTKDTYVEQMDRTRATRDEDLDYWGLCVFGPREIIDPITRKFSLWRI